MITALAKDGKGSTMSKRNATQRSEKMVKIKEKPERHKRRKDLRTIEYQFAM